MRRWIEVKLSRLRPCNVFLHDRWEGGRRTVKKTVFLTCAQEESTDSARKSRKNLLKWRRPLAEEIRERTGKTESLLCLIKTDKRVLRFKWSLQLSAAHISRNASPGAGAWEPSLYTLNRLSSSVKRRNQIKSREINPDKGIKIEIDFTAVKPSNWRLN